MHTPRGVAQIPIIVAILFGAIIIGGSIYVGIQSLKETNTAVPTNNQIVEEALIASSTKQVEILPALPAVKQEVSAVSQPKQTEQQAVAPAVPAQSTGLRISYFITNPQVVSSGEKIKFTWASSNAVVCSIPVSDPSKLEVPFTGRLPEGSLDYVVEFSGKTQDITYWIVCADKDWKTVKLSTVVKYLGPRLIATPYTQYNSSDKKTLFISYAGATAAHVTCVNANYAGPNPPSVVDATNHRVGNGEQQILLSENLMAGMTMSCTVTFGEMINDSFVSSDVTSYFSTTSP